MAETKDLSVLLDAQIPIIGIESPDEQRVLGTLLTWMAENSNAAFIVATSNDISGLPLELIRKGRLDEIFFIDLPEQNTRREIFKIHLKKRDFDPAKFNLASLAANAEEFTGAQIEEAIVSARYLADARDGTVKEADIQAAIDRTYPISVLKAESIDALRAWAKNRTVPA
jgi:SpoVK/Ycf46/Vps4 family AAA+-type ATPase